MKRLIVLGLASCALASTVPASADVSVDASYVEYMSLNGGGSVGTTQYSVGLFVRQSRRVGASQSGTTVTPTNQTAALTIQGSMFVCDYSDYDPCAYAPIPEQPAIGGVIEPLGNAATFSGFVSTTGMGVVPISFDARRPATTNATSSAQTPNAWVDGTTAHADVSRFDAISRSGYVTSITLNALPLTYASAQYGAFVNPSISAQN